MTNREIANEAGTFRDACRKARVKQTPRQASKWGNKKGIAYRVTHQFFKPLKPTDPAYE